MASGSIVAIITNAAAANGVPPQLALAQAQAESSLNPNAYNSKSGATGLFQLTGPVISDYGVANPTDPAENADAGLSYLSDLFRQFGDWATALAAFNWGPGNVAKYGAAAAPASTQSYVSSILGNAGMDVTASVTPSSVASGISDLLVPSDVTDYTDASGAALAPASSPNFLVIGLVALGAVLLWDVFSERLAA